MSGPRRAGADRRIQRKIERLQKYASPEGACAGKSLLEMMRDDLDEAMLEYLEQKEANQPAQTARGIVRGLAMAISRVQSGGTCKPKLVEKESLERVKNARS